jgi:hypothetical protein
MSCRVYFLLLTISLSRHSHRAADSLRLPHLGAVAAGQNLLSQMKRNMDLDAQLLSSLLPSCGVSPHISGAAFSLSFRLLYTLWLRHYLLQERGFGDFGGAGALSNARRKRPRTAQTSKSGYRCAINSSICNEYHTPVKTRTSDARANLPGRMGSEFMSFPFHWEREDGQQHCVNTLYSSSQRHAG